MLEAARTRPSSRHPAVHLHSGLTTFKSISAADQLQVHAAFYFRTNMVAGPGLHQTMIRLLTSAKPGWQLIDQAADAISPVEVPECICNGGGTHEPTRTSDARGGAAAKFSGWRRDDRRAYGLPPGLALAAEIPDKFDGSSFQPGAPSPTPNRRRMRYGITIDRRISTSINPGTSIIRLPGVACSTPDSARSREQWQDIIPDWRIAGDCQRRQNLHFLSAQGGLVSRWAELTART